MNQITRRSYESLKKEEEELNELLIETRKEIVRAKELGDLSENSEVESAKEKETTILERLSSISEATTNVEIVTTVSSNVVILGSYIEIQELDEDMSTPIGLKQIYILDSVSDIFSGTLSVNSDIAKAILGKPSGIYKCPNKFGELKNYEVTIKRESEILEKFNDYYSKIGG